MRVFNIELEKVIHKLLFLPVATHFSMCHRIKHSKVVYHILTQTFPNLRASHVAVGCENKNNIIPNNTFCHKLEQVPRRAQIFSAGAIT